MTGHEPNLDDPKALAALVPSQSSNWLSIFTLTWALAALACGAFETTQHFLAGSLQKVLMTGATLLGFDYAASADVGSQVADTVYGAFRLVMLTLVLTRRNPRYRPVGLEPYVVYLTVHLFLIGLTRSAFLLLPWLSFNPTAQGGLAMLLAILKWVLWTMLALRLVRDTALPEVRKYVSLHDFLKKKFVKSSVILSLLATLVDLAAPWNTSVCALADTETPALDVRTVGIWALVILTNSFSSLMLFGILSWTSDRARIAAGFVRRTR